ncbi:uncharacterized protein LOC101900863 isoform X1 [Musca domestica]|uniref:Uncharacterized protein LOC101900863 isoform X1 n=1 Tax=Musca domestica TaxID=7370 RepID=A0A9J7CX72_MUSDO|nr:uncharacterized protein LOC101900863 isoform X1 [Musca domestica]
MRAHFDIPASPDTDDGGVLESKDGGNDQIAAHAGGDESHEQLQTRIMEFKSDSSKMAVLGEFIDEVLEKAEEEANKQQDNGDTSNSQQNKNKSQKQTFAIPDFKNGKVVNKARGFVVRLFESICNCANNATAAPVARFKFRSGKRAASTTDAPETNGKMEAKREEKVKKSVSVKEKKNDKIKFEDEANDGEPQEAIELQ